MTKIHREYLSICLEEGLHPLGVEQRGKHLAVVCAEGRVFCASTPSDHRAIRKLRSFARRMARGVAG